MTVKILLVLSTPITFIWRMYDGLEMFVALTDHDFLSSRGYGKSVSRVILIFVFRVGLAEGGVS